MADEEEKKEQRVGDQEPASKLNWNSQGCHVMIRILIGFACLLLFVAIIMRCIRFGKVSSVFFYIWTLYLIVFIAMLIISLFKIRFFLMYFTFLNTKKGIGFFMIFIGTLLFDWNEIFELCVSIVLMIMGGLYIFYGFKAGEEQAPPPKEKKKKEDKKEEDRKKQYEDNKGAAEDQKNNNASPPSYQPKGGEIKYHQEPPINNPAANPRTAAGAPPIEPSAGPSPGVGYSQGRSPVQYNEGVGAGSYQPRGEPIRMQANPSPNYAPDPSAASYDDDEEDDDDGYRPQPGPPSYQNQPYQPRNDPYQNQGRTGGYQNEMQPPPPDEKPVQLPDKLKKFKDINDLLF